jgi:hypothetical protein
MAPPNIGALIQTTRKTRSIIRAPHETVKARKEMAHKEGVVDVDTIPSLHIEPTIPTPAVEEAQDQTTTAMEVDSAQGHQTNDIGNLQQLVRAKSRRINGEASAHLEVVAPRLQPEARSAQQQEGLVEDLTG